MFLVERDVGVSGVADAFLAGVVPPPSDERYFLYFVQLVILLFQLQFALASFCDVAILAEHHIFVGAHDALEEVGLPAGDFSSQKHFLELRVDFPVSGGWQQLEYVLVQQLVFCQKP